MARRREEGEEGREEEGVTKCSATASALAQRLTKSSPSIRCR